MHREYLHVATHARKACESIQGDFGGASHKLQQKCTFLRACEHLAVMEKGDGNETHSLAHNCEGEGSDLGGELSNALPQPLDLRRISMVALVLSVRTGSGCEDTNRVRQQKQQTHGQQDENFFPHEEKRKGSHDSPPIIHVNLGETTDQ